MSQGKGEYCDKYKLGVKIRSGRKRGIEIVNAQNFILNAAFKENSKEYVTKPVRAARYKRGMETGFMVYFANTPCKEGMRLHEGMKFFDTEAQAWDYIKENNKQYAEVDGELVEFEVEYDDPLPVLHRKEKDETKKIGFRNIIEHRVDFLSNETWQYDFFILSDDEENVSWIIQDMEGSIRVWYRDYDGENFFGLDNDIVYEKSGNADYIKVAV